MTDKKAEPNAVDELIEEVHETIRSYRCSQQVDEDENGLNLADALTPHYEPTITTGLAELESLIDEVLGVIEANRPALEALQKPQPLRFKFDFWANCWQVIDGKGEEIYADGDHPLRCHLQEDAIELAQSLGLTAVFVEVTE